MINRISHSHLIFSPNSFTNKFNNICAHMLDPLYSVGRVYGIVKIRMIRSLSQLNFLGYDIFGAEVVCDSVFLFYVSTKIMTT